MPTLTIEVLTTAQPPVSVDLNQLDDEQREARSIDPPQVMYMPVRPEYYSPQPAIPVSYDPV